MTIQQMNNYLAHTSTETGSSATEHNEGHTFGETIAPFVLLYILIVVVMTIIDIPFKVKAMWRAARLSDKGWFICLFLFNTAGILPIIYLRKNKDRYNQLILKKYSD